MVTAGIHRAPSIKVAEAAKVIENTQRDLNIAFMNELSLIFQALEIDTGDVLAAARTKWNFLPFQPGLVGGHCIGVDPYLPDLSRREGRLSSRSHPRRPPHQRRHGPADRARMHPRPAAAKGSRAAVVTILGMTFKENVPDIRNSRVIDIVRELQSFGIEVQIADPLADAARGR